VKWLKHYGRPVICTEYMARSVGGTFEAVLPIGKEEQVGMINWGLVASMTTRAGDRHWISSIL
jgi:hypothetical protein